MIEDEKKQKINTIHEDIDTGRYRSSDHVEDIDYLVDNALIRHKVTSHTKKVEKKYSPYKHRGYRRKRKIHNITNRKLTLKKIAAIALALFIIVAAIPYILPPLYGDFGTDVIVAIDPDGVRLNETLFVNVSIPSHYNITSVSADMASVETVNLELVDNSTSLHLWSGVWLVQNINPDEHVMTIYASDGGNGSYSAGARLSVLPEEIPVEPEPPAPVINDTVVPVGLNLTLLVDKNSYDVGETVSISGVVTYNNSVINAPVDLSVVGPDSIDSVVLNASDGNFDYQFVPSVAGSYIVQALVSYLDETVQDEVVFDVLSVPVVDPVGFELSLEVDNNVYVVDETVLISGVVSFNNSLINTSVNLSIISLSYNLSIELNASDGSFSYEFIPVIVGSYVVQAIVSYLNESVQEEISFDVTSPPVVIPEDLNVSLNSDKGVYVIDENVLISGTISFNHTLVNIGC